MNSGDEQGGFRDLLARRIQAYVEQLERVQKQLLELHDTLNTTQQRLDTAREMYRLEFNEEPPGARTSVTATVGVPVSDGRVTRRRRRTGGTPWNETVVGVLRKAREPLHLNEIWARMQADGFQTEAKDPLRSLASVLVRHEGIVRTGRNTYGLAEWAEGAPQLHIDQPTPETQARYQDQEAVA
jgi:hypothetical protein